MKAWKEFWFEASHSLPDNPQVHGHSFKVKLWFETSKENPVSFKGINKLEWQLKRLVDHTHLNTAIPEPTMESIAVYLYEYGLHLIEMQKIDVKFLKVDVYRPSLDFGIES